MPWPKGVPRPRRNGSVGESSAEHDQAPQGEDGQEPLPLCEPEEPETILLNIEDWTEEQAALFIAFWEKATGGTASDTEEGLLLVPALLAPEARPLAPAALDPDAPPLITLRVDGADPGQAERLRTRLQGALDSEFKRYRKFPNRRIW